MKTAFIYPGERLSPKVTNPYIDDFTSCISNNFNFINKSKPSKLGFLDLYVYLNKIDIVFLNWIEDLPDKRGGLFQTFLFIISVFLMKRRKIKIFYTLHNKESHYSTHKQIKRLIRKIVLSNSDFVLCHSKEGIDIINNEKGIKGKTLYLPHPFKKESLQDPVKEKKYDILIWGAIRPYKGIDKFFSYLESNNILKKYKTLVAGKIFPEEYEKELIVFRSDSLHIINSFIEDKVLNEFIAQSKITLFTYNENSVLSSGALIYSLSKGANVIGPNTGAFKDLYQEGLIEVFENYDELIEIIDKQLNSLSSKAKKINKYIEENSWEKFGSKISDWILGNNK